MAPKQLNIGLLGCGTVGTGVVRGIRHNGDLLTARLGVGLRIARIGVRDTGKKRTVRLAPGLLTSDLDKIVRDPAIDVVVELIGGTRDARRLVLNALRHGKSVVTANRDLLSTHGEELFSAAARYHSNLFYEGTVAGGIPLVKILREGLVANKFLSIRGILNGACNHILTRMTAEGLDFATAHADARRLGLCEASASFDADGYDSAQKVAILASLAHGFWIPLKSVYVEGIRKISQIDIEYAGKLGYVIKLLGIVKSDAKSSGDNCTVEVRVHPTLVPKSHVLASVSGDTNAVAVRGDLTGDLLFCGRGGGSDATASAVVSDLADCARDFVCKSYRRVPPFTTLQPSGRIKPMDEVVSRYYLRATVMDRPGVLAQITTVLARHSIGVLSVVQPEAHEGGTVPIVLTLHEATDGAVRRALGEIDRLPMVKANTVMIRMEHF